MKKIIFLFSVMLLFAFKGVDKKTPPMQACLSNLDGKAYSYNINSSKPNWSFYFLFYCEGDSMRAVLLGPNFQGSAGGFFFRSYVNDLSIQKDSISFNFIPGQLYRFPFTLNDYKNYGPPYPAGFSQDRLFYKGIMKGDSIISVHCQNKYYACTVDSICLKKIKK